MGGRISAPIRGMTALSIEFVCKSQEAYRLATAVPQAVENALGQVSGFAGCVMLVSDKEPRLARVMALWEGESRATLCRNSAPWIHELLAPFLDHCLNVETHNAYLPAAVLESHEPVRYSAHVA